MLGFVKGGLDFYTNYCWHSARKMLDLSMKEVSRSQKELSEDQDTCSLHSR